MECSIWMPDDRRIVMYTVTGGFNISLGPIHLTVLNTPISMSVIGGISHTSLSCWRFNRLFDEHQMTQTPDIFSLVDAAWKHTQYPCLCILPLEFGVNIHIRKHENSEVLCSNRSKSPREKSVHSRVQKHREHVNRFYLTKCTGLIYPTNDVILLWIRYCSMKVSHRPPVHAANLVANTGKTVYGVDVL